MARLLLLCAALAAVLPRTAAVESITISRVLPQSAHTCISKCVYHTLWEDVGNALGCDFPRDNRCYCATPEESVNVANDWFASCATSRCSAGDVPYDLSTMRSVYASYCLNAGYTQTGVEGWLAAQPTSDTGSSDGGNGPDSTQPGAPDSPATKTTVSIVTETVRGGAGQTRSEVTRSVTSTVYVNTDGSPADGPRGSSSGGGDDSKWKIAVGVAVPLVVILAAVMGWLLWRRRRNRRVVSNPAYSANPPAEVTPQPIPPAMTGTPISRKPVASPTVSNLSHPTEVSGEGLRQELNPQGVDAIPTALPAYTGGRHEMQGQELRSASPDVEVSGEGRPTELAGVYDRPRSELPGSERFIYNG